MKIHRKGIGESVHLAVGVVEMFAVIAPADGINCNIGSMRRKNKGGELLCKNFISRANARDRPCCYCS